VLEGDGMKLNSCTTIELKKLRHQGLCRLVKNADQMAEIDAILVERKKQNNLNELTQPKMLQVS